MPSYPLMLKTAPAQQVAAYSCPPSALLPFLPGQDTFSLCWQKSPQSPIWECKWHISSLSTGVCCPCSHLKTFPWYLLKKLDNTHVMTCKVIHPCSLFHGTHLCHLWSRLLQLRVSPRQGQHSCSMADVALHKEILVHCKGLQTRPQMQALRTLGSVFDVPAQSAPALQHSKVSLTKRILDSNITNDHRLFCTAKHQHNLIQLPKVSSLWSPLPCYWKLIPWDVGQGGPSVSCMHHWQYK